MGGIAFNTYKINWINCIDGGKINSRFSIISAMTYMSAYQGGDLNGEEAENVQGRSRKKIG